MKTTLVARVRGTPRTFRIWNGELDTVPHIGDSVTPNGDYGTMTVADVTWDLSVPEVTVSVTIHEGDEADLRELEL
jgi:hypothetical protein